jgi:D-alanine-D-alanine ligase-like ATP-grasp enzyme
MSLTELASYPGATMELDTPAIKLAFDYAGEVSIENLLQITTEQDLLKTHLSGLIGSPESTAMVAANEAARSLFSSLHWFLCGAEYEPPVAKNSAIDEVLYPVFSVPAGRRLATCVRQLIDGLLANLEQQQLTTNLQQFLVQAECYFPGRSSHAVISGAKHLGIPCYLTESGHAVQLGQGRQQKTVSHVMGPDTGPIAALLSSDKIFYQYLIDQAINIPTTLVAENESVLSVFSYQLGYPLVVKPAFSTQYAGVTTGVEDEASLIAAYREAAEVYPVVLVQSHVEGRHYRALLSGGKVVAFHKFVSPLLQGDGKSTVAELIEAINKQEIRRQPGLAYSPNPVKISSMVTTKLARSGYALTSVLPEDECFEILEMPSCSRGGYAEECLAKVHPDTIAMLERAVRLLDLPSAGLDVISQDISQSCIEGGVHLVDINPRSTLGSHVCWGTPENFIQQLLEPMGIRAESTSIPCVVCMGQSADYMQELANAMTTAGRIVALVVDGVATVDGFEVALDADLHSSLLEAVCRDPEPDLVLLSYSETEFLEQGIPWQDCACLVLAEGQDISNQRLQDVLSKSTSSIVTSVGEQLTWGASIAKQVHYSCDQDFAGNIEGTMVVSQSSPGFSHLACYQGGKEMFEESSYKLSSSAASKGNLSSVLPVAASIGLSLGFETDSLRSIVRSLL